VKRGGGGERKVTEYGKIALRDRRQTTKMKKNQYFVFRTGKAIIIYLALFFLTLLC
jgi:hypothetical protein